MANNSKATLGNRTFVQTIYSEPRKIFVKRYLSAKGARLSLSGEISPEQADKLYGRNLYAFNHNAKPINTVVHKLPYFN